jgi:large subunit ribosomal protein L18
MTTNREQLKRAKRQLRHHRVRMTTIPKTDRPRLAVFRSSTHIYAQIIDDKTGKTLVSASSNELKSKSAKTDTSTAVGTSIAQKATAKGITKVVFDRGGYRYHGRVKALAEAARAGGLEF